LKELKKMTSIKTENYLVELKGDTKGINAVLTSNSDIEGIEYVTLKLTSEQPVTPGIISLNWTHAAVDIHAQWNPGIGYTRGLNPDWTGEYRTKSTSGAPVQCLYNYGGRNRLTFALSDALNTVRFKSGVNEETSIFRCSVELFIDPMAPIKEYEVTLRMDTRDVPYYKSLKDVSNWWTTLPGFEPTVVPDTARLPMYSTWYSFHQQVDPEKIIEQCRIAKKMGCEAVIVDDGWQTDDNNRGYAYCGDWEVTENKIKDMRGFVDGVHEVGMKFMLWYSVPFVGKHTKAWDRFVGKFLDSEENQWCVLDPRFPEVREYLINIYENAVKQWDLDGLKLDFVDSFNLTEASKNSLGYGRDYDSVPEAVDRLLKDALERLKILKPDFMIEFRQSYIGPLMRTYGNMFRAGDCPNDSLGNRVRTLDIRLLCGDTAAHSDMMMWNPKEPVESAAMQIINILFSVPQISVLLDKIPDSHYNMIKYWLDFWRDNREVLLDGEIIPLNPESLYTQVFARKGDKLIGVSYTNTVLKVPQSESKDFEFINGAYEDRVIFDLPKGLKDMTMEVRDCCGNILRNEIISLNKGINLVEVPPAGLIKFHSAY
jgi:alpha-galactosidase